MTHIADPNWFGPRIAGRFAYAFGPLAGSPVHYLEIGVCAGFSLFWMAKNVLTHPDSRAVGIDFWDLNPAPVAKPKYAVGWERMARQRLEPYAEKVRLIKGFSQEVLRDLAASHVGYFDIVYVDGDHTEAGALADSRLAWPLAKDGAVVVWDDLRVPSVAAAVDAFLAEQAGRYEPAGQRWANQVWVRKVGTV